MSDHPKTATDQAHAPSPTPTPTPTPGKTDEGALANLMAAGDTHGKPATKAPDLEAEALRAAEHALAEGERALAAARVRLQDEAPQAAARPGRGRELALRGLLVFNVVAMIVVAMLPAPGGKTTPPTQPTDAPAKPAADGGAAARRRFNEPWLQAQDAAERQDFAAAITILEGHLAESPNLPASQQLSVLQALAYYASRANDFARSDAFRRRAEAIDKSHALPEDLVQMAKAALDAGDQEGLRRVWARFLLQQRQIPPYLYKHVAAAYLQLGDSYRLQAETAAEAERKAQLQREADQLRQEALSAPGGKTSKEKGK